MTASDIFRIVYTVAITQAVCDILTKRFVYSKEPYQRSLSTLERARIRRDKAVASVTNVGATTARAAEKNAKKVQRAQDEFAEACADVARRHTGPSLLCSIVFVILYRVLSLEYSGKVVAVLPFQPWSIIQKFSMRGISFDPGFEFPSEDANGFLPRVHDPSQGCSFLFIYVMSTLSVKYFVNKILGEKPPSGADKGILNLLDDPRSQRMLEGLGLDTEDLNAAKKLF
mmetsp:Transcript_170/g.249  ORF Transcript_170/g.249 Transcript_170/m.249 type:complete len:228 (-) Transcript_170:324-1007(-)